MEPEVCTPGLTSSYIATALRTLPEFLNRDCATNTPASDFIPNVWLSSEGLLLSELEFAALLPLNKGEMTLSFICHTHHLIQTDTKNDQNPTE